MLRVGHLNVYHLYNKVPDVFKKILQSVGISSFGITESRLDFRITDLGVSIPDYHITRRDPQLPGQTGIAMYVRQSVQAITHRLKDLENEKIVCIWLEVKPHAHRPPLFVC